jgi:uncharacterized integral membrane protein
MQGWELVNLNVKEISKEKKTELFELVEKQKKAKISWVGTITQLSEDQIINIAPDLGLAIEKDLILLPSETKEAKSVLLKAITHKETSTHTVAQTSKWKRFFKKPARIAFTISLAINIIFVIIFAILMSTNTGWASVKFAIIAFPIGLVILIFAPLLTSVFRK